MEENEFIRLIERSIEENWDYPALTNYQKDSFKYSEVAVKIQWLHCIYEKLGIKKGDKVALIGRNLNTWGIVYLGTITYGATIVPILPDFNSNDIHHILNHSESKLLFSTDILFNKIDDTKVKTLLGVFSLTHLNILSDSKSKLSKAVEYADKYILENKLEKTDIKYSRKVSNDDMAVLSYTSGSSGFSKGVMIPYRSLSSNIIFGLKYIEFDRGDRVVSFLPLAHVFGCAFEFLTEFCKGVEVVFVTRIPSPQMILKAFKEVKPKLVLTVPLIIEKLYKRKILPVLNSTKVKLMLKVPFLEQQVYKKINEELIASFGGNFVQVIIGGAALSSEVESFLKKIKFPFTVGYGMTECGPLISYKNYKTHKVFSCGSAVDNMEIKILSENSKEIPGEVLVKGKNVMLGYYKNGEENKKVFTKDGWLRTGDMGIIDKDGDLFLKGRTKNMILGPSGQNIYPEEIEAQLNNMPYILETVVTDDSNSKLVALAYPDYETLDHKGINSKEEIEKLFEKNRQLINKTLPAYMQLTKIQLYPEEFKKTPKKNIKRYLYTDMFK
ncbi:MAG: AMP-binding protein [Marinifilaceae bacterium]|jgi:long-chain acyl-CoA synthetase|nr:AMP-binding protein [Marinifilaceae bacterium]